MRILRLTPTDNKFPKPLKDIPDPPKQLFVISNDWVSLLAQPRLAVVGSRKMTPYGNGVTTKIASRLAGQGVVIVSGLAMGIDSAAHRAALDAGGLTIAVLASGLDQVHPRSHLELAKQIVSSGGALVSEYPVGTPPLRPYFIARNRLVSGLASGLLITEAAAKSGSLHTAGFALDQGKPVMAVPGNITSATSEGTNNLLKTGAVPVTDYKDVLFALGLQEQVAQLDIAASNPEEQLVLELLQTGVTDGSELLIKSGLQAPLFNQTLTMLEIHGKIRSVGGGHWQCL